MQPDRMTTQTRAGTQIDAGLRSHFLRVYNIMAFGLVVTGLMAWITANTPAMMEPLLAMRSNPLMAMLIMFSPMILVGLAFNPASIRKFSFQTMTMFFVAFSAYFGWLFSTMFLMYSIGDITRVFFITSGTFAAMSIWGYTTKKDLATMGSFLMMGIIGLFIAIVVNIFMQSSMMMFVISGAGVLIYTLMTAYDTQMIKESYSASYGDQANGKMAVMGALSLYINFIMLFQFLMTFFGGRE